MIARVQYRELDDLGIRAFSVSEPIELPFLTENTELANKKKLFKEGGKFYGIPAEFKIMRIDGNTNTNLTEKPTYGFMVEEEGGVYVVPENLVLVPEDGVDFEPTKPEQDIVETTKEVINVVKDKAENFDPEKTLGFNYKQLIVMAVLGIVIVKLLK